MFFLDHFLFMSNWQMSASPMRLHSKLKISSNNKMSGNSYSIQCFMTANVFGNFFPKTILKTISTQQWCGHKKILNLKWCTRTVSSHFFRLKDFLASLILERKKQALHFQTMLLDVKHIFQFWEFQLFLQFRLYLLATKESSDTTMTIIITLAILVVVLLALIIRVLFIR